MWNERYMALAKQVAAWSKDPSTQVGAVITEDNYIRGIGYNGFPRKINDTATRLKDTEIRHKLMIHAEMNALRAAEGQGDTIFIYPCLPCNTCLNNIMQTGITRIVCGDRKMGEVWNPDFSLEMIKEARIDLIIIPLADITLNVQEARETMTAAMDEDPGFAWSWHCNVAVAMMDEGVSHEQANAGASRFMEAAFGVETGLTEIEE